MTFSNRRINMTFSWSEQLTRTERKHYFVTIKKHSLLVSWVLHAVQVWISRRVIAESDKVQKGGTDQGDGIAALLGEIKEGRTALFRKEKAEEGTPGAYKIMTAVDAKDALDDTGEYGYACGFSLNSLFYCHWQRETTEAEGPLLWPITVFLIIAKIWTHKRNQILWDFIFTIYLLDVCVIVHLFVYAKTNKMEIHK